MYSLPALLLLLSGVARAEEHPPVPPGPGFDAHGFVLAALRPDPRGLLTLQRPFEDRGSPFFAGGVVEFAKAPLVARTPDGRPLTVVDNLVALNTSFGVTPHERVRLDVAAPLFLTSTGLEGAQGVALGDVRLASMVTLLRPADSSLPLAVAVVPWLDLPTGAEARFLGQSRMAGGALVAGTVEVDALTVTANLGAQLNPSIQRGNLTGADSLVAGLGIGWMVDDDIGISGEVRGLAPMRGTSPRGTAAPVEAVASVRHIRGGGGHLLGGLAAGLSPGVGAAAFRLFVGGGFGAPGSAGNPVARDPRPERDPCAAEVLGLLDPEACPEIGPVLTVRATSKGAPVDGAALVITGAETRRQPSVAAGLRWRVQQDCLWKVEAKQGECLTGEQIVQVRDVDLTADVALRFVPAAIVRVVVVDEQGAPVRPATVTFRSAEPACVPAAPVPVPAFGSLMQDVGVGEHTVRVEAAGFTPREQTVTVALGEEREVEVVLER